MQFGEAIPAVELPVKRIGNVGMYAFATRLAASVDVADACNSIISLRPSVFPGRTFVTFVCRMSSDRELLGRRQSVETAASQSFWRSRNQFGRLSRETKSLSDSAIWKGFFEFLNSFVRDFGFVEPKFLQLL